MNDQVMDDTFVSNPYRDAFYQRQAEWHGYEDASAARGKHEARIPYYQWYTQDWLPPDRSARVLDIGCASGQFLYFLKKQGYRNLHGIDLDRRQVAIARELGLDAECAEAIGYLKASSQSFDLIAMLDIIEHFRRDELFPLMSAVVDALKPGGRLIASVPNAESPNGLACYFTDITHEMAYTPLSFEEMAFCHGLKATAWRDPWPAPVSPSRRIYRTIARAARSAASLKYRLLGLQPPRIWSNVFWVMAEKVA